MIKVSFRACSGLAVMLCLASAVFADDFSDFRVPKHRVFSVTGDFNGRANRNTTSRLPGASDVYTGNSLARTWNLDGTLSVRGFWLYDSDPLRIRTSGSLGGNGDFRSTRVDGTGAPADSWGMNYSRERRAGEYWSLGAEARAWLPHFPAGVTGSGYVSGSYLQDWTSAHTEDHQADRGHYSFSAHDGSAARYYYNEDVSAGVGFGRVRDVSVVYDVFAFEQRLKEQGVLKGSLSHAARQKLMDLAYFENQYDGVHDRPAKFYWQEIENVLVADSAVSAAGIHAFELYRLAEPYVGSFQNFRGSMLSVMEGFPGPRERSFDPPRGILRERGWFAGLVIYASHAHNVDRTMYSSRTFTSDSGGVTVDDHTSSSSRAVGWREDLTYGPQIEGHLPWGMRWQFDALSSYQQSFAWGRRGWIWTTGASATWIITDRWLGFGKLSHRQFRDRLWEPLTSPPTVYREWNVAGQAEVHYFIEDHTTAYVDVSYGQGRRVQESGSYTYYYGGSTWSTGFTARVGVTYRFLGRLWSPGIASSSLLPWQFH